MLEMAYLSRRFGNAPPSVIMEEDISIYAVLEAGDILDAFQEYAKGDFAGMSDGAWEIVAPLLPEVEPRRRRT